MANISTTKKMVRILTCVHIICSSIVKLCTFEMIFNLIIEISIKTVTVQILL